MSLWAFPFGLFFKVLKRRMLEKCFYTLVKGVLFSSPIDMGSHNSSPSGLSDKATLILSPTIQAFVEARTLESK